VTGPLRVTVYASNMTVTLTPTEVEDATGIADVTAADIVTASWLIDDSTGYDPTEHVDDRGLDEDVVKQAWSIVSARVHVASRSVGAEAVTSETQGDYQVTTDVGVSEKYQGDLLAGLPRQLLGEEIGYSTLLRAGSRVVGPVSSAGFWWV
jgi:hypothetical protein